MPLPLMSAKLRNFNLLPACYSPAEYLVKGRLPRTTRVLAQPALLWLRQHRLQQEGRDIHYPPLAPQLDGYFAILPPRLTQTAALHDILSLIHRQHIQIGD